MRRSVALFTLLRIRFWTANEKKDIFGWSQSPSFNNLKKTLGLWGREWVKSAKRLCRTDSHFRKLRQTPMHASQEIIVVLALILNQFAYNFLC